MQAELRAGDRIPMSGDAYQALGSDVRGEYLLVVSPSPTWRHDDIVRSPASFIEQALPEGTWVRHQWARKPGVDEYLPDLVVFDETDEGLRDTGASHLSVGVLDLGGDVDAEFGAYDEAGLPRYRIIERGRPRSSPTASRQAPTPAATPGAAPPPSTSVPPPSTSTPPTFTLAAVSPTRIDPSAESHTIPDPSTMTGPSTKEPS